MSTVTLYHNPKCSKSRQALALLQEANIELTLIEYLKTPLSVNAIKALLGALNMDASDLLRKKEAEYVELDLANKSEADIIEALHAIPKLMERPIVLCGEYAAIGRPTENINTFIKDCL